MGKMRGAITEFRMLAALCLDLVLDTVSLLLRLDVILEEWLWSLTRALRRFRGVERTSPDDEAGQHANRGYNPPPKITRLPDKPPPGPPPVGHITRTETLHMVRGWIAPDEEGRVGHCGGGEE